MRLALCCCGTTVRQIWPVCLLFPFLVALPVRDCRSDCRSWPVSRASPCCCVSPRSSSVPVRRTSVLRWLSNGGTRYDRQENRPCLYTSRLSPVPACIWGPALRQTFYLLPSPGGSASSLPNHRSHTPASR